MICGYVWLLLPESALGVQSLHHYRRAQLGLRSAPEEPPFLSLEWGGGLAPVSLCFYVSTLMWIGHDINAVPLLEQKLKGPEV